jgi:hypothetical protein
LAGKRHLQVRQWDIPMKDLKVIAMCIPGLDQFLSSWDVINPNFFRKYGIATFSTTLTR